ncbi:Trifunctional purine biosynthetic protein adenosine-3 [Armadillidium nasatum]|uniref:phosphoribosylformylglycinamidine cyclo-ligase n=1 Tax=Armadillidium nasatum TaxID=96803 RepID=A0A5N5SPD3_9CRUS|nr:Trifunctional purine biosynthetic protein adenosine-3 [Armadillidium nasatum]
MCAKLLLIGSGGREHAIAKCLASSGRVKSLFVAPGNAGTCKLPKTRNEVIEFCRSEEIIFVVIGPEDPLADGLADTALGTALWLRLQDWQVEKVLLSFSKIVLEEKLTGFEISVIALSDGKTVKTFPPAQDHKPRFAGGLGKNTGGMGAYCPCPLISKEDLELVKNSIIQKVIDGLRDEGCPYIGTLYAGLMVSKDGPQVLEFNCRFGDPETQSILPLLTSDLYSLMLACTEGKLDECSLQINESLNCVSVAVVIDNYPGDVQQGLNIEIEGIENILNDGSLEIYFAGTKLNDSGHYLTSGGRVLNICGVDSSLKDARDKTLEGAQKISFKNAPKGYGADFRKDIAFESIKKQYEIWGRNMTYTKSGVDVDKGNKLVNNIKELCSRTNRPGVKGDLTMFGSVFDTKLEGYQNPLLVSGTDGVGTKLKIAIEAGVSDTVGEDLVAMSVNDILVHGAEPLFFLDYFATGKLDKKVHEDVIKGISNGCLLANCSLVGGETAEMPGMYRSGDYDIAGFTVGAVEEDNFLPKLDAMKPGNMKSFLKPTLIYTPLLKLLRSGLVLGAAHVTGGGIKENILRVIPKNLGVTLDTKWKIPSVYAWLSALGVNSSVLHHTFNLGIGFILIVENKNKEKVLEAIDNIFNDKFSKDKLATYPRPRLTNENDNVSTWIIGSLEYKKGALLDHTINWPSNAEIVLVVSNVAGVQGLERAKKANVPTMVICNIHYFIAL